MPWNAGFIFDIAPPAAMAYNPNRTRAGLAFIRALTICRTGSASCSSIFELLKVDSPVMDATTVLIIVPSCFSTLTASGVSDLNMDIIDWNPEWPERVCPHFANFAVMLSRPVRMLPDTGMKAFRIPKIPLMMFPMAVAIPTNAGPEKVAIDEANDFTQDESMARWMLAMTIWSAGSIESRNGFISPRACGSSRSPAAITVVTPGEAALTKFDHAFFEGGSAPPHCFWEPVSPDMACCSAFSAVERPADVVAFE